MKGPSHVRTRWGRRIGERSTPSRALVAPALAPRAAHAAYAPGHVSAPRRPKGTDDGQERGRGARVEVHGRVPEDASLQAAVAQYFAMDAGEDTGQAPAAERPSPLREVGPQARVGRHGGIGFEPCQQR